jgi:hypothetical protein
MLESLKLGLKPKLGGNKMARRDGAPLSAALRESLDSQFKAIGSTPQRIESRGRLQKEVERLHRAVNEYLADWAQLPAELDCALVAWIAARGRAAQEAAQVLQAPELRAELDRLFPALRTHTGNTQHGFVYGLALQHGPRTTSWLEDARAQEERVHELMGEGNEPPVAEPPDPRAVLDDHLRQLLEDKRSGLVGAKFATRVEFLLREGVAPTEPRLVNAAKSEVEHLQSPALAPLRKAVERAITAAQDLQQRDEVNPESEACLAFTRDKRVVIVGGDPRPELRDKLYALFRFSEVEWLDDASGSPRELDSLAQRAVNGTVDLVLLLTQFVSHKASNKLTHLDNPRARIVYINSYGLSQIRLALEKEFGIERVAA